MTEVGLGGSSILFAIYIGGAVMLFVLGLFVLRAPSEAAFPPNPTDDSNAMRNSNSARGGAEGKNLNSELSRQLSEAGFDHPWATQIFYIVKIATTFGFGLTALTLLANLQSLEALGGDKIVGIVAAALAVGYFLPTMVVDKRRSGWKRRIELAVPDAMDFMLVCVEAGQSVDLAAARVGVELEPIHPDLAMRFGDLTKELAAGASREEAFANLATVTDNRDLRQFGTLVVQSSVLGTPMAHSLRVFASDIRDRRIRSVEEKASVLPTKMTLGTMMFTVPPLLILLMTPAIYRLLNTL